MMPLKFDWSGPWNSWRQFALPGLLLGLVTILPYANTFGVPWYFDDIGNIVENPLVRNLSDATQSFFDNRGPAIFSFALNYRWGGLDPAGYHAVNLLIHLLGTLMVWLLLRRLLGGEEWLALGGAALFAVHPLQTQSVTYVVQRMTSLSGLLFFLAVHLYLLARDVSLRSRDAAASRHALYYAGSIAAGGLAVLVKQNAAILPLTLLLVERFFFASRGHGRFVRRLPYLLPFCVVPLLLALHDVVLPMVKGAELWKIANQTSDRRITVLHYLVTEFSVIWIYLRLFFLPFGQVFDLAYPVVEQLATWQNLAAFSGLAGLFALAFFCRNRRPLVAFGILWFLVALVVESTFIPLDPYNEHRLYVPLFGLVLVVVDLLRTLPGSPLRQPLCCIVLAVLMVLTWQRNALWADPVLFFEDNLRKSPRNVRVMVMLGNAYARQERDEEAVRLYEQAMQVNPDYDVAYTAAGKLFIQQQDYGRAVAVLERGKAYNPESPRLNEFLGIAHGQSGQYQKALLYLNRAAQLKPDDANIIANIGQVQFWMGDDRQAAESFGRSLQIAPDNVEVLFNYASALFNLGEKQRALDALRAAVALDPDHVNAQYGRASLALAFGLRDEAVAARDALRRLGDARAAEFDQALAR